MIWQQAAVCFLVWVGYGFLLRRRAQAMAERLHQINPRRRGLLGTLALIASGIFITAGLALIGALGGLQGNSLTLWAWLLAILIGLGFVHLQVWGGLALVSTALATRGSRRSSPDVGSHHNP